MGRKKTGHSVGCGSKRNDDKDNEEPTRPKKLKKADNGPEGRYRHKCNPSRVYAITNNGVGNPRAYERARVIQNTGFGSILGICNWKSIPSYFIKWIAENFEPESMQIRLNKTDVLKLTEADVERVYGLPRHGRHIDLSKCKKSSIKKLRSEIGLEGDYSDMVSVNEIEHALTNLDNAVAWSKAAIICILGCLLCPTNNPNISLMYAGVLEDFENLSDYNWCKHVLDHIRQGIPQKGFKNPRADFHFLLINYMDRMGKESPLLKGITKGPTLYDWDIKTSMERLSKINQLMGLERGITCGITKMVQDELSPGVTVLMFDADTCPIEKAPENAKYCEGQIEIYRNCLKTLKRRMKDEEEETEEHEATDESEARPIRKRKRRQSYDTVGKRKRNVSRRNYEKTMPAENSDDIQELNTNTETDPEENIEQNEPVEYAKEIVMVSQAEHPTNPEHNTKQNEIVEVPVEIDMVLPSEASRMVKIEVIEQLVNSNQYQGDQQITEMAITPAPYEKSGVMIDEVEQTAGEDSKPSLDDVIAISCVGDCIISCHRR